MLLLTRSQTAELASLPACIDAVEEAFRMHASAQRSLGLVRVHLGGLNGGVFHLTGGGYATADDAGAVAVKLNGRFPARDGSGSQRVSGAILLADAATGIPLALLDSLVVTALRTAAITAIVVRLLGRPDASRALLVGAGKQGRGQLEALRESTTVTHVGVYDLARASAESAAAFALELGFTAEVVDDVSEAAHQSDIVVTVTPARAPILRAGDIGAGALVVALGADAPGKQELDPALLTGASVVVDLLDQAAESGELQHALALGTLGRKDVHAELADIIAGTRPGRLHDHETFVFDGTGTALQDVAAAALIVAEARRRGVGVEVELES